MYTLVSMNMTEPPGVIPGPSQHEGGFFTTDRLSSDSFNSGTILTETASEWKIGYIMLHYPMTDPCMLYMVTRIPSIYPSHVSIYIPYMEPMGILSG